MLKLSRVNFARTLYDTFGTNDCKRVDIIAPGEVVLVFEETMRTSGSEAHEVFVLTAQGQTGWIVVFKKTSKPVVENFT